MVTSADLVDCCVDGLIAHAEISALSDNTRKTYKSGWNSWARWAKEHNRPIFKPTVKNILRWLASLYLEGKKPATLRTYLAAVAHRLRSRRGPNPARNHRVRLVLSGLTRRAAERGITTRQAAPLRLEHVVQITDAVPTQRRNRPGGRLETPEQARTRADTDIAMILLLHNALLRCSELLALTWADVEVPEDGGMATIWIRRSKTDQNANGTAVAVSERAAQAINSIKPPNARADDRVFDFSPSTVRRRIKAAAKAAGIDPSGISTHSPRVGMAQNLAAADTGIAGIMLAGRWDKPETAARYIQHLAAHHTPAAQYLKSLLAA